MKKLLASIVLASSFIAPGYAAVLYTSPTEFASQLAAGAYTESFGTVINNTPNALDYSQGMYSYTVSAAMGLWGTDEFLGTYTGRDQLYIDFTGAAVTAIGGNFYNTNADDAFNATTITIVLSDGTATSFTPASVADSYRGFISDTAISSVTLSTSVVGSFVSLDNFTVGARVVEAEVPEPGSLALGGIGLLGLAALRRRRPA